MASTMDSYIYYFAYRHNRPTGGQKDTYRHVDILNKHGLRAAVFHPGDSFRVTWFTNDTKVISMQEFQERYNTDKDYVVIPEDLGTSVLGFSGRKIIFNKNLFYGFRSLGVSAPVLYPYTHPDVIAAFAVSDHNKEHLKFAFPNLRVYRVDVDIDLNVFSAPDPKAKKPLIACIPKNPDLILSVYHTLMSRMRYRTNLAKNFDWIFLGDKTESEVAAILRDAVVFVFLSATEGMARMPLEAAACGCLVVGYDAGPNAEFLPPYGRFPHHDIQGVVSFLEKIIDDYPNRMDKWKPLIAEGRALASTFSQIKQEENIMCVWREILAQ
jgi:glycosyltransferase involved in cell wall biosynthesis